jgi:hypothetical protein
MKNRRNHIWCALPVIFVLVVGVMGSTAGQSQLPEFGRDTVLVWNIQNEEYEASFVVRIAEFYPDRFVEWEDEITQGTIFMPNQDLLAAKGFVNASLFSSGRDAKEKNVTTLWLSRQIYRELKDNGKAKCRLDGVAGLLKYLGDDQIAVEVNKKSMKLPVIKVMDDRGSERWFLDQEDNPLMLSHRVRKFRQNLSSITTDQTNTLRWIKGKKLPVVLK